MNLYNFVSVIIPCYNVEKSIKETLDSLYNQTYRNFEIICINDGSTDQTAKVINSYKQNVNIDISLYSIENSGVSFARNYGIEKANGRLIMFLDADDKYASQTIEIMVDSICRYNADTAYSYWTRNIENFRDNDVQGVLVGQKDIMNYFMYKYRRLSFVNFIYRAEIIEKHEIKFDEHIRYGEDNLFFWQYLANIKTGVFVDKPLYWYSENKNSAMHNPSWRTTDGAIAINKAYKYLASVNFKYLEEFYEYMLPRTYFSIAKEFARYKQKMNYKRFYIEYDLNHVINLLINRNGIKLSVCAVVLWRFPGIFYCLVSIVYSVKNFIRSVKLKL